MIQHANPTSANPTSADLDEALFDSDHSWAHASGWAQLSGSRRTVSCVLPCGQHTRTLQMLMPILSDTLTECGYPWELLLIDHGSDADSSALLHAWTDLPGFRHCQMRKPATSREAFTAGLSAARGDAVILFDPRVLHSPELVPRMILLWEADAVFVHASHDPDTGRSVLRQWDAAQARQRTESADFTMPAGCTELCLLDRQLIDWVQTRGGLMALLRV